jgi:hypothetical protein
MAMHRVCGTSKQVGWYRLCMLVSLAQCEASVQIHYRYDVDAWHSWSHPPARAHSRTRTDTIADLAIVKGLKNDVKSATASACTLVGLIHCTRRRSQINCSCCASRLRLMSK